MKRDVYEIFHEISSNLFSNLARFLRFFFFRNRSEKIAILPI